VQRIGTLLFVVLLLGYTSGGCSTNEPAAPALSRGVAYKPIVYRVTSPTLVAFLPPITFGRPLKPREQEAWEGYSFRIQALQTSLAGGVRVIPTSADTIVVPGRGGGEDWRIARSALRDRYGFVFATPGRKPKTYPPTVSIEKMVHDAKRYFGLRRG
jgi:hypothetical protein